MVHREKKHIAPGTLWNKWTHNLLKNEEENLQKTTNICEKVASICDSLPVGLLKLQMESNSKTPY